MIHRHGIPARVRFVALALGSALFGSLLTSAASGTVEAQPNMVAARQSLARAVAELTKAPADKGGHRYNAIQLAQRAIVEVNLGINYANQH